MRQNVAKSVKSTGYNQSLKYFDQSWQKCNFRIFGKTRRLNKNSIFGQNLAG